MNKPLQTKELIRQARLERGLTQRRLAEAIGADTQTVRTWERGTRSPSLEFWNPLYRILEKSPEELGLYINYARQHSQEPEDEIPPERIEDTPHKLVAQVQDTHVEVLQPEDIQQPDLPQILLHSTYRKDENRLRMIRRVHARLITGALEHISNGHLLNLHLQEEPNAVDNPWKSTRLKHYIIKYTPQDDFQIMHIYDEADGELLILGEAGAGKTTLLLNVLRELLVRAERDDTLPIPVIFHLSSWAEKRPLFANWLVEELRTKYQVPQKLAEAWITNDRIIPLLDGLDEVEDTFQTKCIEAINEYRQEHGLLPMVICSRKSDYLAQPTRIILNNAVVIQPLTIQQIDEYISHSDQDLTMMRDAMQQDILLQEMASNPLMLHILALSYQEMPIEDVLSVDSMEARRNLIFEKYVEQLLQHRSMMNDHYTSQQTKHWLKWLARQLVQHSQTEFYIERIQPDWLPNLEIQSHYQHIIVRLIFSIEIMIVAALFSLLRGGKFGNISGVGIGLLGWLGAGPGNSVLGWMAPGLGGDLEGGGSLGIIIAIVTLLATLLIDRPIPKPSWRMFWYSLSQGTQKGLLLGIPVGLFSSLLFGPSYGWSNGIFRGLAAGLFTGLLIGLMTGLITGLSYDPNKPRQPKSRQTLHVSRNAIIDTCIFTICAMVGFGTVYALLISAISTNVIIYTVIVGMFFGIAFGVGGGTKLIRDIGVHIQPAETVAWSWIEVGRNFISIAQKGFGIGIVITVSIIVIISGISGFFYGFSYGLRYGLIYGMIIGLVSGIAGILAGVLRSGWSPTILEEHQFVRSNEGIRRSARNALIAACFFGSVGGVTSGFVCGIAFGWVGQLRDWPILSMGFAIICGLIFATQAAILNGGIACIEHYMLRFYLWRTGSMPWKYSRFLDFADECILLRKLGGGYMFSHRLLLEYFASLKLFICKTIADECEIAESDRSKILIQSNSSITDMQLLSSAIYVRPSI